MKRLTLRFSEGQICNVWIGTSLVSAPKIWSSDPVLRAPGHAVLIADSRLRGPTRSLQRALQTRNWRTTTFRLSAGEQSKDFRTLESIYGGLIESGADRQSVIFALGGGVIGDVAGFIAATYMRGIRWVGVPSTLLAQVDSSLGGKTGVNHPLGKNLIGAFHQPSSVICDLDLLKTLPKRELVSGLGEIAKYALLSDQRSFNWIEKNWDALLRLEEGVLGQAVARCLRIKAEVVQKDERETRGLRASLNLGHTVGHALETATGFSKFRHGEAVIHGLHAMLELSEMRGYLSPADKKEMNALLKRIHVPAIPSSLDARQVARLTRRDKKAQHGRARFVLLKKVGRPVLDGEISQRELVQALRRIGLGESL